MAPDAVVRAARRPREHHRRGQPAERLLPLVAPDLQVHVDDVVVGDGQAVERVADRERPRQDGRVVPDDPEPAVDVGRAERVRRALGAELRRRAGPVLGAGLADVDVRDRLAVPQRDVAVPAREDAVERVDDVLLDLERAVRLDDHLDVRLREREVAGRRAAREHERRRGGGRDDEREPQKLTCGASRAAGSSSSKYSRSSKSKSPATTFVGTVSSAVSYVRTASL